MTSNLLANCKKVISLREDLIITLEGGLPPFVYLLCNRKALFPSGGFFGACFICIETCGDEIVIAWRLSGLRSDLTISVYTNTEDGTNETIDLSNTFIELTNVYWHLFLGNRCRKKT